MSNAKSAFLNILLQKNWQTFSGLPEPGLPAGRRGKRVGLVVLYEYGGRYNIDPNSKLSNPFITIKLLFYDDIFHHSAESFFIWTAAGDIVGELFDEVGASVPAKRFTDFGNHAKNISISAGELYGDVGLGIRHFSASVAISFTEKFIHFMYLLAI